jgi:hypothetical protein
MKTKDIQVGEEYAIGSPNATYDKWSRARAKVLAVAQTGIEQGDWRTYSCMQKKFVEIELITDLHSRRVGLHRWQFTVDVKSGNYSEYDKHELKEVHRVPSGMVLKPWADYAKTLATHEQVVLQREEKLEAEIALRSNVIFKLTELGFDGVFTHAGNIQFSVAEAQRVVDLVTALKGAVGENAFNAFFKERTNG